MDLSQYSQRAADWRGQIRKNKARTRRVILVFILLYLSIGLLIDVALYSHVYYVDLKTITYALLTLQLTPHATLVMAGIAGLSLFVTYSLYDKMMLLGTQYHEISSGHMEAPAEKSLFNVVEEMKIAAGLNYMPRIFIIDADYMNAFASGYSEKSAMIAITRGLLTKLDRSELQAVVAHELSHIRHLDIKLTLTVGVLSNIMLIAIDVLFYSVVFGRRRSREGGRLVMIVILLRYLLPLITVLLMLYLSRTREYMADAGCVELMRDNAPLANALLKIHNDHQQNLDTYRQAYGATAHEDVRRASYLYDPVKTGVEPIKSIESTFSTHPTLEDRLRALGYTKPS